MTKCYTYRMSALYVYFINPSLYRTGMAWGREFSIGKDDSCENTYFGHLHELLYLSMTQKS